MKKSHVLFGLTSLILVLYGIIKYDTNTACYEIIPPQGKMDTMLLDKCKGRTFVLVKESFDEGEDGNAGGFTYRWTTIRFVEGGEPFWSEGK